MNKQQLASKIWESANQMRSKIEANEYKDYILGFIFYKYLSDQLLQFVIKEGMAADDIKALNEKDAETVEYIQDNLGYFIAYDNLFSTWVDPKSDFDESNVRDALSAFSRLISPTYKKLFDGIFNTLETGLSKLGESASKRTKAISDLLHLIKSIPMDAQQGYDVLGYIYEYLLEKFAANAGKKAGEFYTPHEVSVLMSHIIAHELKHKDTIEIYDPTSGSGSLLINIGQAVAQYAKSRDSITYYAQELKVNTYNLTRMNLIMRGIKAANIKTRNGDTLEEDWPYFDESDPQGTYQTLYVDAVVSNPPYSQQWDPSFKENDPRYARFGLAPKSKADFAFLLHDLYHLKPDGIMTIVLPHGVLFRGGEEGEIRKQLIEQNHVDTIIGLPSNIFYGTGIPTVILVLKQKRDNTDVLVIDASKHFVKEGKNNKLQASDIKRITDTVVKRESIDKFSQVVSKETLRDNDYNLNIPRYVDSSEASERWDLHATMLGGIPNHEIARLHIYWESFPQLHKALFTSKSSAYSELAVDESVLKNTIVQHSDVVNYIRHYNQAFEGFDKELNAQLVQGWHQVDANRHEAKLSTELFKRLSHIALIDKYQVYQSLNDQWQVIRADLEMMQMEGFEATTQVDPNIVIKKRGGIDTEVQEGWKGHILPFDLVQQTYLHDDLTALQNLGLRLNEVESEIDVMMESFTEEEKSLSIFNDNNDAFLKGELNKKIEEIYAGIDSEEIGTLNKYIDLLDNKATKQEKVDFVAAHPTVDWSSIKTNKDGTYGKGKVNDYLKILSAEYTFEPETFEAKLVQANNLLNEQTQLNRKIQEQSDALHLNTKTTIEGLNENQVKHLLHLKWITPLSEELAAIPKRLMVKLTRQVQALADKYATTYTQVVSDVKAIEQELIEMMGELTGNEFDQEGLVELTRLLKGE